MHRNSETLGSYQNYCGSHRR